MLYFYGENKVNDFTYQTSKCLADEVMEWQGP